MSEPQEAQKLTVLDGMRGVAALIVMFFHFQDDRLLMGGLTPFPKGWLAVDFFFILSGFVIALAYERRFAAGLSTARFMATRVVRIYPLYLVGTLIAAAFSVLLWATHYYAHPQSLSSLAVAVVLGVMFVPEIWPGLDFFPLNFPAWSLMYELVANLFYKLAFGWLSNWALLVLVVAAQVASQTFDWHTGEDLGIRAAVPQLIRVAYGFFAGVLVFRLWRWSSFRPKVPAWLLIAVLVASLASPRLAPFDYLLFPALVYLGACAAPRRSSARLFDVLGAISVAVYMLHIPISNIVVVVAPRLIGAPSGAIPWLGLGTGVLVIVSAIFLDRFYDRGARRALISRLAPGSARAPAQPDAQAA